MLPAPRRLRRCLAQLPAAEGANHERRVTTKRCDGVKSPGTLWNRLMVEVNRASQAVERSIAELREIASGLKAVLLAFCA